MELSPYTNRPIATATVITYPVVFWCETCRKKLPTPMVAITHLNCRSHQTKLSSKNRKDTKDTNKENERDDISKIKYTFNAINEVKLLEAMKKQTKEQSVTKADSNNEITCEDCKLVFDNHITAIQHFKGKKHVAKITSKATAKQQSQRGSRGSIVRGRVDGYWRGRGGLLGPVNNFYDRRLDMFDHPKDNFYMNPGPPPPCGPPRNGYGGGYYNGFCGNNGGGGVPDYRSQHQNYPPDRLEDQFSSDGEPVKSLLSEPRPKSTNEYYYDYNSASNNASENKSNTKKNKNKGGGGAKMGSWLPGRGRGLVRPAYNGYNNSGYNNSGYNNSGYNDKEGNFNNKGGGYPNSMSGNNNAWWDNNFIKGPSMRGISKYEYK